MSKKNKSSQPTESLPLSIVDQFFPPKVINETADDIRMVQISNVLEKQGISKSHLPQALAVLTGIISSRLGDPVPMVITEDEGAGAVEFLDSCLNLAPEDSWVEISDESKRGSITDDGSRGKTVVSYDADSVKNELMKILVDIERSRRSGKSKKIGSAKNGSPSSFVVLTRNHKNPLLQNRYVTRIHLTADQFSKDYRLKSMAKTSDINLMKSLEIESACVKTLLKRAVDCPVDIEFAGKIMNKTAVRLQNVVPVYDLTLRIIRNITRLNNVPPIRHFEYQIAFIGLDYDEILPPDQKSNPIRLKASKIDYYYFLTIFGSFMRSGNDYLNPRALKVFDTIFSYNIKGMEKYRKKGMEDIDLLNKLHSSAVANTWVTRQELFDILQSNGSELFSDVTLHNILQELLKREVIVRRRTKRRRYSYEYAANRVPDDEMLFNTDFSQIKDSVTAKSKVPVKNIYTGKIEKI